MISGTRGRRDGQSDGRISRSRVDTSDARPAADPFTRFGLIRFGLLAAALSLPIWAMRPLDFVKFGDIKYDFVMIIAVWAGTLVVMEAYATGAFGFRPSAWLWGLGGVVVLSLVASLASTDPVTAVNGTSMRRDGFLMIMANSMLFLTAYRLTQSRSPRWAEERVAQCLVAAGVPVCAYALMQSMGKDPFVWESFRGEGGRAFSTLGNPIFLGAYAATATLVALGLWLEHRPGRWAWVWPAAAGMAAAVTILTAARASWWGLAAGVAALALTAAVRGRVRRCAAGLFLAAAVGSVLVTGVLLLAPRDRAATLQGSAAALAQPADSRNSGRMAIWAISLRMIADHPLLGVGPDSMGGQFEEYRTPEYDAAEAPDRIADKPHSSLLEWGVETGIPGAVLTSGLVAALLFAAGRILFRRGRAQAGDWTVAGIWAGALAYSAQSTITVTAIGVDGMWWVLLGLLAGWIVSVGDAGRDVGGAGVCECIPRAAWSS